MGRNTGVISVVKSTGELGLAKKKASLKKPSRKMYTDAEKKEMSSLRAKNRYYRKRITNITKSIDDSSITMQTLRRSLDQDTAYACYQAGYFNEPDYSTRDIREWMTTNGDDSLLRMCIDQHNDVNHSASISYTQDGMTPEQSDKIDEYNKQIADNEKKIGEIKEGANQRKNEEMLEYMNEKSKIKNGQNLLQMLSEGKMAIDKLSDPELAAIRGMKTGVINAIYKNINWENIPDEYQPILKRTIYASIMENPLQGLRDAMGGVATLEVAKKYGNAAGQLAGGMTDFATSVLTGKPNTKAFASTVFSAMVSGSKLNPALTTEIAQDLIASGESTNSEENMKQFGRDVLVDIAKDVITSGGNIYAAAPKIIKDIFIDFTQSQIRGVKASKKDEQNKKEEEEAKKAIEKAKQKADNVDMNAVIAKFGQ